MRLSCGTDSFPMLPHELSLDLIKALGFEGHDITLIGGDRAVVPLDQVRTDIPGWAAKLDERVRSRGLELGDVAAWADYKSMAPNHPDPAQREHGLALFRDVLALAARLGSPGLTMVPGIDWPGETHEESLLRAGEAMQLRAEEAAAQGLRFSVEPHVGCVCHSPAEVLRLCELAPDLRLTLDYSHYVCQGYTDDEIEPLLPYVGHFHARGTANERLQAPLKDNTVDYERIVDRLQALGYDRYIAVEYVWVDWGGLNEVDILSETVLMRDRLRAKLAGEPWSYPEFNWPIDAAPTT